MVGTYGLSLHLGGVGLHAPAAAVGVAITPLFCRQRAACAARRSGSTLVSLPAAQLCHLQKAQPNDMERPIVSHSRVGTFKGTSSWHSGKGMRAPVEKPGAPRRSRNCAA